MGIINHVFIIPSPRKDTSLVKKERIVPEVKNPIPRKNKYGVKDDAETVYTFLFTPKKNIKQATIIGISIT